MKFMARKQFDNLRAIDEPGRDALRKLKNGALVLIEVKQPRNPQHHRKLFAMLNIVLNNQEYYKSIDTLLSACKLATGHAEIVRTKRGDVAIPKSISFSAMSQGDFNAFYDAAVQWVIDDVIPGLSRADLDAEIEAELKEFAA
jgi:hypothetical protein